MSVASSIILNPKYKPGVGTDSYREDVSALIVANPAALGRAGGVTYLSLPAAGVLDQLQRAGDLRTTPIQVMGYGTEAAVNGSGGHTFLGGTWTILGITSTRYSLLVDQHAARIDRSSVRFAIGVNPTERHSRRGTG